MHKIKLNKLLRSILAQALGVLFNNGSMEIRTGPPPNSANDLATGVILATVELPEPAFNDPDTGVIRSLDRWPIKVFANGRAGYFRLRNVAGTVVLDGGVTPTGGGGALELDDINISLGRPFEVTQLTFTHPELL